MFCLSPICRSYSKPSGVPGESQLVLTDGWTNGWMGGQAKSKKIMYFQHFSKTIRYFFLVVSFPLKEFLRHFLRKTRKKIKKFKFVKKFRTTFFFSDFFDFSHSFFVSHRFFFTPIFCHQFFKVGKVENFPIYRKFFNFWKFSNSSDFSGKISTFSIWSENWHT